MSLAQLAQPWPKKCYQKRLGLVFVKARTKRLWIRIQYILHILIFDVFQR